MLLCMCRMAAARLARYRPRCASSSPPAHATPTPTPTPTLTPPHPTHFAPPTAGFLNTPRLYLGPPCSVLCEGESELQPIAGFLDHHGPTVSAEHYLDASMRRTATSWLVEVASEFGLHQETLFLGVALLDRFLSSSRVRPRGCFGAWQGPTRCCCHPEPRLRTRPGGLHAYLLAASAPPSGP